MDKLKGEFCYVQMQTGRIVSIHYSPNENKEAVNIKRGIAGAFQANFDNQAEVEELDPSSSHISHYRYLDILLEFLNSNFLTTVMRRHPVMYSHLLEQSRQLI